MPAEPLVSIVIPFFNAGRFLAEAIDSVVGQSHKNWEIQLVNDGSSDDGAEIARRYVERYPGRIFCHHHIGFVNKGQAASRNLGVRMAAGSLVAFLDADDIWLPHKLAHQVALLSHFDSADMVYGRTQYWHSWAGSSDQQDEAPDMGLEPEIVFEPPALATINYPLGTGPAPPPSALLMRRDAIDRIDGFVESFVGPYSMYEDQAFLIKVYLYCRVVVSSECGERYRQHEHSISAEVTNAGRYHEVREYFLRWFESYVRDRPTVDRKITDALEEALRECRSQTTVSASADSFAPSWRQRLLSEADAGAALSGRAVGLRNVSFGSDLMLLGSAATRMVSGGVKLELLWKALALERLSRNVAVHVVSGDGLIRAQADYPQDQGIAPVRAGTLWRDVLVIPQADLDRGEAVAIGVFEKGGEMLPASGAAGDWEGRRVWIPIPPG